MEREKKNQWNKVRLYSKFLLYCFKNIGLLKQINEILKKLIKRYVVITFNFHYHVSK